jgi:hypothetical protein
MIEVSIDSVDGKNSCEGDDCQSDEDDGRCRSLPRPSNRMLGWDQSVAVGGDEGGNQAADGCADGVGEYAPARI